MWEKLARSIIIIIISVLGIVSKSLKRRLEELEIKGRIKTIQTTTLLRSAKILRRVLETWVLCGNSSGHVCLLMHVFVAPILSVKCPAVKGPFRPIQYWVAYVYKSTNILHTYIKWTFQCHVAAVWCFLHCHWWWYLVCSLFVIMLCLRCLLFLASHFPFSISIMYRRYSNFSVTLAFFQNWFLPYGCTVTWSPFLNSVRSWVSLS